MKPFIASVLISLSLIVAAGCGKKSAEPVSCNDVFSHILTLMPDWMKEKEAAEKDAAIAKCEKLSPEARQCALDAKSPVELSKCPHS